MYAITWGNLGSYSLGVWYSGITISNDLQYIHSVNGDNNIYEAAHDFVIIAACLNPGQPMTKYFPAFTRNGMVHHHDGIYQLFGLCGQSFESIVK